MNRISENFSKLKNLITDFLSFPEKIIAIKTIRQYYPWLLLLFTVNGMSALLLWLADVQAFRAMILILLFSSVMLFLLLCLILGHINQKREKAFLSFLNDPDEYHEELLLKTLNNSQADAVRLLGITLRNKINAYNNLINQLSEYEEYVESWAHETKTPLSLLTLLLDNRRDELPEAVAFRLDYIRNRMQEFIDQMLYYARLKGIHKDYLFENIDLALCIEDILEDYRPLLEEKQFLISCHISTDTIYTDRRSFNFLLRQIISNSIKYSKNEPELSVKFIKKDKFNMLTIRDNGIGVRNCDLPYIFEKGFTGGDGENREKATGMGLYLAKEISKDLGLSLNAKSEYKNGFEMQILFPVINNQSDITLHN